MTALMTFSLTCCCCCCSSLGSAAAGVRGAVGHRSCSCRGQSQKDPGWTLLHARDAEQSHQEVLRRLEDESVSRQVSGAPPLEHLTATGPTGPLTPDLLLPQGFIHGTHSAHVGRTHQPPGPERRHLAQQVTIISEASSFDINNNIILCCV